VVLYNRAQRMHASCLAADGALARLDSVLTASYPGVMWEGARLWIHNSTIVWMGGGRAERGGVYRPHTVHTPTS